MKESDSSELRAALQRIEVLESLHRTASQRADYYARELEIAATLASDRERRLAVALYRAHEVERHTLAAAASQAEAVAEAKRACEEHEKRADWASDERARLARCYEDACAQAATMGETLTTLQSEITSELEARNAEIAALRERCAALEEMLFEHLSGAIAEARSERSRLSELVTGLQRGRLWGVKRAIQRLRDRFRH